MPRLIEQAILALYFPIVLFSGAACWLYIARVLWPAVRSRTFRLERHAVALAATAALLAHFTENLFYGTSRIFTAASDWMQLLSVVAPMKLIILFSSILAVAVYNRAVFGAQNLLKLNLSAAAIWLLSWIALLMFND